MLEVKNLKSGYGRNSVISDISFSLKRNKLTIILGPNGSGKTTLLKTVAGVLNKKAGNIYIDGKNSDELSLKERSKKIAYMPQVRHIPNMTVKDFLICARYPYLGISKSPSKEDYSAVFEAVKITGTEEYCQRKLKTLSGGERQKIYLAMALVQRTDLILLDEPVTYLDIENQFEIMALIDSLKGKKTILMVCHDIRLSLKYADYLIIMDKGGIIKEGTRDEILDSFVLEKTFNIKIDKLNTENSEDYIINTEKKWK